MLKHTMTSTPVLPLRVLIADDQPLNLRLATRLLREMGHGGVLVTDGQQALQALQSQPFDLVLMDVTMPVLDGLSALREIRAGEWRKGGPQMPVIMVTAHDLPADRECFRLAGADGFVAKPLDKDSLQREVQRVLGRC